MYVSVSNRRRNRPASNLSSSLRKGSAGSGPGSTPSPGIRGRGSLDARRRLLRRYLSVPSTKRRVIRQGVSLVVAAGLGLTVFTVVSRADEANAQWGATAEVLVASRLLEGGNPIEPGDVEPMAVPLAVLPDTALTTGPTEGSNGSLRRDTAADHDDGPTDHLDSVAALRGRRLRSDVAKGQILTRSDVVSGNRGAVSALLEADRVAVTVPIPSERPPLEIDDAVDVYGPVLPDPRSGNGSDGFDFAPQRAGRVGLLATSARVLGLEPGSATLSVSDTEVEAVLGAAANGTVLLAITG